MLVACDMWRVACGMWAATGLAPFVERFKAAGVFVIHKCVAVRHAKSAARLGVDMISMGKTHLRPYPPQSLSVLAKTRRHCWALSARQLNTQQAASSRLRFIMLIHVLCVG